MGLGGALIIVRYSQTIQQNPRDRSCAPVTTTAILEKTEDKIEQSPPAKAKGFED